jgi:hypothetical protein
LRRQGLLPEEEQEEMLVIRAQAAGGEAVRFPAPATG